MLERSAESVTGYEDIEEDDDLTFHTLHDPVTAVCSPDKESSLGILHSLGFPLLESSLTLLGLGLLDSL